MILNLSGGINWTVPKNFISNVSQFITDNISFLPSELPTLKISEHAEKLRILPNGSPRPGPLDISYTEYLREPMDCLSPDSEIQRVVVLKGAQSGWTMLAECILCYYMGYAPSDILFMSSTADSLERWASRRLEPAIDSYGYRKHIYAQETNTKTRKSGDTTYSKSYHGCRLDMASYNSPAAMASTDKRILIRDETDRAPLTLSTGEGSPMAVSAARVNAWGDRSKILDFSTPTTYEDSYIYKEYLKGDQRKRFMKCPDCGKMITFENEFDPEKRGFGFKAIYDDGEVIDCVYCCQCGYEIKEHEKQEMVKNGEWIATAKSSDKYLRSYHCPSFYAPSSMLSWVKIYKKYLEAVEDPDIAMRTFVNIYAGMPFQESGARPKIDAIHHLRGTYNRKTVPEGVLFLTGAVDVQRGADKYQELNDDELEVEIKQAKKEGRLERFPRLEMEILGTGSGYRTWSIDYVRFEGHITNVDGGAWKKLTDYFIDLSKKSDLVKGGYKIPAFKRQDGRNFEVMQIFVDAHDGETKDYVYQFTGKHSNFMPSMGFQYLKNVSKKKGDYESTHDISRYRIKRVSSDLVVCQISTNHYKKRIYGSAKIDRQTGEQFPRFMDHPIEYDDRYFSMLFGAEVRKDGSFHDGNRAVEALDCKTYAMAASDYVVDSWVKYWQDLKVKEGKHSQKSIKAQINKLWVLKWFENNTKPLDKNNR